MEINLGNFLPIVKLKNCASKDETRYHLTGVSFNLKTRIGQATDGHLLAESNPLPECDCTAQVGDPESVIIAPEALAALAKVKPGMHHMTTVTITRKETCVNQPGFSQCWQNIDGSFPNCAQVYPKGEVVVTIGLDADLLVRVADAIKELKGKGGVKISITDKNSPILVETAFGRGLVMPMRL
jgi:DNA polymerase III sliding clamp (beta) subunit (PCNA family)